MTQNIFLSTRFIKNWVRFPQFFQFNMNRVDNIIISRSTVSLGRDNISRCLVYKLDK